MKPRDFITGTGWPDMKVQALYPCSTLQRNCWEDNALSVDIQISEWRTGKGAVGDVARF